MFVLKATYTQWSFWGDSLGYFTYMCNTGFSTVDYAIASESLLPEVKYFKTNDFTYLSDHVQINLYMNCSIISDTCMKKCLDEKRWHLIKSYKWTELSSSKLIDVLSTENVKKEILDLEMQHFDSNKLGVDGATEKLTKILQTIAENTCKVISKPTKKKKKKIIQISSTLSPTSKNVCPVQLAPVDDKSRNISKDAFAVKCCPNFFEKDDICEPCPAGTYGKSCMDQCEHDYYGIQCKVKCNCSSVQVCNKIIGCVCPTGYKGNKCDKEYQRGKFADNYAGGCNCAMCTICDNSTGNCSCYEQSSHPYTSTKTYNAVVDDHSSHLITVYIGMAAALMVLVCIVASIVKIKQEVYRYLRSGKKNCPTMNLKRRKNIPKKSERNTRNVSVEAASNILETHVQPFLCELGGGYCEISEVSVSNHTCTRQNDVDQINSTS
ncbi:unnamed protein product [Mytilus edulis]|uniref:EGF-like domain-containing protein n=1 Tax=Mytilus edulis TaxID=6550 RepID=A0A8S3TP08_MYTED|nr:unnamed protein product [Mytilus edulis]